VIENLTHPETPAERLATLSYGPARTGCTRGERDRGGEAEASRVASLVRWRRRVTTRPILPELRTPSEWGAAAVTKPPPRRMLGPPRFLKALLSSGIRRHCRARSGMGCAEYGRPSVRSTSTAASPGTPMRTPRSRCCASPGSTR
jgi:hypothetical protein